MALPLVSLFCGQDILGANGAFTSTKMAADPQAAAIYYKNLPATLTSFLGLAPGSVQFGPLGNGVVFACSGAFFDLSAEGIANQQLLLLSYANAPTLWLRPTGLPWPGNAEYWKNAYFIPQEVVFSPTTTSPGNQYTCTYKMLIRTLGNS